MIAITPNYREDAKRSAMRNFLRRELKTLAYGDGSLVMQALSACKNDITQIRTYILEHRDEKRKPGWFISSYRSFLGYLVKRGF